MSLEKNIAVSKVSRITLTNNESKYIIKGIKSLEKRAILLKGTTEKSINQKRGWIGSLMRVGLPLMKNVLAPLTKIVLLALGVTVLASVTHAAIQKKNYRSGMKHQAWNERYPRNS